MLNPDKFIKKVSMVLFIAIDKRCPKNMNQNVSALSHFAVNLFSKYPGEGCM
jgi:hypothetical protein